MSTRSSVFEITAARYELEELLHSSITSIASERLSSPDHHSALSEVCQTTNNFCVLLYLNNIAKAPALSLVYILSYFVFVCCNIIYILLQTPTLLFVSIITNPSLVVSLRHFPFTGKRKRPMLINSHNSI